MTATTVLICLAFSLCLQSAFAEWDLFSAHEKEFLSDDAPKDLPGKGTETSVIVITDNGSIRDLNVKLNITHPYYADLYGKNIEGEIHEEISGRKTGVVNPQFTAPCYHSAP